MLLLAACGGGDDAGPDAAADLATQCEQIRTSWRAEVSTLSTSCTTDPDCATIGAIPEGCLPLASLATRCEGVPVSAAASTASQADLTPLADQWRDLQCANVNELGRTNDCRPLPAICDRGTCVLSFTASCFPVDAGVL